jgi:hypothetical protein
MPCAGVFFQGPDTESKEDAINKFLDGMEDQERSGFKGIDRFLGRLPVPAGKETRSMSHSEARAGEFLPDMDAVEQKGFTPSELQIYTHALEYRYILYTLIMSLICMYKPCISKYIHDFY